jgi:hypothetical protein
MNRGVGWFFVAGLAVCAARAQPAPPSAAAGEAEASRCLQRIAAVKREVLGKYEDQLAELQLQYQKAADLENALAVRAERKRLGEERDLTESNFVPEPRSLRTLQQQSFARIRELGAAVVNESLPKLIELRRALTIAGQLDDAVMVRALIERLQREHLPLERPQPGQVVPVETLLAAYEADRARGDKAYKEARFIVRGTVGGFRADPEDAQSYIIFLRSPSREGWVACFFNSGGLRFREENQFNATTLIVIGRNGQVLARVQAGQAIDIEGTGSGFSDFVRLVKCDLVR